MSKYVLVFFFLSFQFSLLSQFCQYDGQFNKIDPIDDAVFIHQAPKLEIKTLKYKVDSRDVIEFLDSDDVLVGIYYDHSVISIKDLKWVQSNNELLKLLDKYTESVALSRYFNLPRVGMTMEEMFDVFGEGEELKYSIDGYDQLISCTINQKQVLIRNEVVVEVKDLKTTNL